jgi:hypothetical protein
MTTVAQTTTTHTVRGGGGLRLHVPEWGKTEGPPILLIHGLPRTQAQPAFQEERGDEQHPEQHQVQQQACARSAEVRDPEARLSLRPAQR